MVDNAPPRMVMHQLFRAATPVRIHGATGASIPRIAGQGRGMSSGGGLARSFASSGGGTNARASSEDPAVTGDFNRNLTTMWGPFKLGGGEITEKGQRDKADYETLQQGQLAYLTARNQGATEQEAAQIAVRAGGVPLLMAMQNHPSSPLASAGAFHQLLGGGDEGPTAVGLSKSGSQVLQRDANGNLSYSNIPGFEAPPQKLGAPVKTSTGLYDRDPTTGAMTPTLGPNGEQLKPPASAKTPLPLEASDIPGLPPQQTSDTPKTQFNRQNYNTLAATPEVMAALGRMNKAADAMGPVKGPLAVLSGEYFGLNGTGAQFKADQDLIRTQAQKMTGSAYAANTKNFMEGIGTSSNAPSFIKLQSEQLMSTLRNEGQEIADKETADHQGKLPPSLVNNLTKVGIVPNGYQTRETLDQMPPGEAALWKSRFFPQTLDNVDKAQLATDAVNGKFGPPGAQNNNADFKNIIGMRQKDRAQEMARQQQQTASTAAQAAQVAPSPAAAAILPKAGAQQPQQPAQGGQQQPQQGPTPAPQQQQPNGQQGQGNQPAQNTPPPAELAPGAAATAPISPLMPAQAVPGQPAQGMPATGGPAPQPPASPLPLATSQTLTPQGGMPTPATQAPVQDTLPNASASAPLPPLEAATLQLLQQSGVPTDQINNQQTSGAPGPQ